MPFTATIQIIVTPLPDNDVWFINSESWTNYWQNISGLVTITAAANSKYIPVAFDNTIPMQDINIDGNDIFLPSLAAFRSLQAQVAALDASYQDLRTQMKAAGIIAEAQ